MFRRTVGILSAMALVMFALPVSPAFAESTVTLDSEASCRWLDGDDPDASLNYTITIWHESEQTCEVKADPNSPNFPELRELGGGDLLIVPIGVTLVFTGDDDGGFPSLSDPVLRVSHGNLINHGTLDLRVSAGTTGAISNWGLMTEGVATSGGSVFNQPGGEIRGGSIANDGGSIVNEGLITLSGGSFGAFGASGRWVDTNQGSVLNLGTVENRAVLTDGLPNHVISNNATFRNYGTYLHDAPDGEPGSPMEIFGGGTFRNVGPTEQYPTGGTYVSLSNSILINHPQSPLSGPGTYAGGGAFIIECGSSFIYPYDTFIADSPVFCDSDGDGVDDGSDVFPNDASEWADADGDTIGDNADTDDDNDGQSDVDEIACGSDPLNAASTSPDFDGDYRPDCVDPDDDDDGVADGDDAFPHSDTGPTTTVNGVDTGVANRILDDGATFNDLVAGTVAAGGTRGQVLSALAHLTDGWRRAGLLSGREQALILSAAAHSM
jgi:hypothetical protein